MATTLKGLKIRRVALVDKGANQEAFVTLYKRDDAQEVHRMETETVTTEEVQPVPQPETVAKADYEAAIAKAAEADALAKAARDEAAAVKAELAKRDEAIEIAKFTAEAQALPGLGEQGATWLRAISKALGADYDAFKGKLVALATQVETGALFQAVGSDGAAEADFNAVVKIAAEKIRKDEPRLTPEQAYVKALEQPAVKDAYARERGKGR